MTKEEAIKHLDEYKPLKDIFDDIQQLDEKDLVDIYRLAVQKTKKPGKKYDFIRDEKTGMEFHEYEYNYNFYKILELIPIEILKKYPEICIDAVKISPINLDYIPEEMQKEHLDIVREAIRSEEITGDSFTELNDEILEENEDICLELVKDNANAKAFRYNSGVRKVLKQRAEKILEGPPEKYIEEFEKIFYESADIPDEIAKKYPQLYLIKLRNPAGIDSYERRRIVEQIPENVLKENLEITLEILQENGYGEYVKYIPTDYLKQHSEICEVAIENGENIKDLPEEILTEKFLKGNPGIWQKAVYNGAGIKDLPEKILTDDYLREIFTYASSVAYVYKDESIMAKILSGYSYDKLNEILTNESIHIGSEWQDDCLEKIKDSNNVILSAPTGAGKTRVMLEWVTSKDNRPIFITAPIKELSNQRFRELQEQGFVVGLETGDIKSVPEDCDFICCTQEIYTNKYLQEDSPLIVDEFGYIFENEQRARAYIDAMHKSNAKDMLICSATMGNIQDLKDYVEKVSKRDFKVYETKDRLTKLNYKGEINKSNIKNALVVSFSKKNIEAILQQLSEQREYSDEVKIEKINNLADKYKVENTYITEMAYKGLAGYYR